VPRVVEAVTRRSWVQHLRALSAVDFRSPLSRRQARGNDARKVRRLFDNAVNVPSFTQVDRVAGRKKGMYHYA
jgi:hypothetical protein